MLQQLGPALRFTALLTVLTGLIYPGVITGLCQVLFRNQANGSLVRLNGQVIGSRLIGQGFVKPEYFHPRPSAAGNDGYDATASSGSNFGPTNEKLITRVRAAASQYRAENPSYTGVIPADATTASASGLDPQISLQNAHIQAARVAQARHADASEVNRLIDRTAERRDLGFLGEPRVNVLALNLALDRKFAKR